MKQGECWAAKRKRMDCYEELGSALLMRRCEGLTLEWMMGVLLALKGGKSHLCEGCAQGRVQLLKLAQKDVVQLQGLRYRTTSVSAVASFTCDVNLLQCYDISV